MHSGGHLWQKSTECNNFNYVRNFCTWHTYVCVCMYRYIYTHREIFAFSMLSCTSWGLLEKAAILYSAWIHFFIDRFMLWCLTVNFSMLFLVFYSLFIKCKITLVYKGIHSSWNLKGFKTTQEISFHILEMVEEIRKMFEL